MIRRQPDTFEELLDYVLKSLHEGTYAQSPEGAYVQAMIIRIQGHEGSRKMAAEYVYPPSGATLVTALAFEKGDSWVSGGSQLRQLAEAGVDPNLPDDHGRVGSIHALTRQAGMCDEKTLHWATRHGANAALTEITEKGARSWLSMDFGEASGGGKRTPEFWHVVQTKVNTALRKIAKHHPDELGPTLERMASAPVHEANAVWFARIKARYLAATLDKVAVSKPSLRPRM